MTKFPFQNLASKKICALILFIFFVSGCASYKYEKMADPYQGYVVKRNDYLIPEYTIDTKSKAPEDLIVAKQRFKRRHNIVDDYYKKMGRIENQFKVLIVDYPLCMISLLTAVIQLPYMMVCDYKYEHNAKYKERVDSRYDELDRREARRKESLQLSLNIFIERDLRREGQPEKAAK